MELACSAGSIDCFASPPIDAHLAGIGFSPFGFTAALFPHPTPWSQARNPIPFRTSVVFNYGTFRARNVDFQKAKRMMAKGDGVRLITAVLLAGQMMTPDKLLVAESCPRQ
jgi:hypothetical protein